MKGLLTLVAGALLAGSALVQSALAQSTADACASARDPVRCDARQAALKTCAAKRNAEKQACLEAHMPPPDCRRTQDPARCEAEQRAREICRDKTGKALKQCLRDEQPRKTGGKPPGKS